MQSRKPRYDPATRVPLYIQDGKLGNLVVEMDILNNMNRLVLSSDGKEKVNEPVSKGLKYLLTRKAVAKGGLGKFFNKVDIKRYTDLLIIAGITSPDVYQKRSHRWKLVQTHGNLDGGKISTSVDGWDDQVEQLQRYVQAYVNGNHGKLLRSKIDSVLSALLDNGVITVEQAKHIIAVNDL